MGLRHKLVIVFITFQILSNHCMPHHTNHSKISLSSTAKNITSSHSKRMKKEAICNNFVATNISKSIHFPNVEYPSDSGHEEYHRFLNEYPIQFKSNNNTCNCSCQAQKCKMETKHKRNLAMAANAKSKHKVITSIKKYDPELQPNCCSGSGVFPEVEYPLSTRDMWMPKYWSQLQGVKRNDNPSNATYSTKPHVSNYDSDSENAALNALIKTLNTKNVQTPSTSDTNLILIPNETVNSLDGTNTNRTYTINNNEEKLPNDKRLEDTSKTANSQSPLKLLTTKEANERHDDVDSKTKSTITPCLSLSNNVIETQSTVNPDTERLNLKDSETQIKSCHNSSTPIDKTSAESLAITTTTTSLSTNIVTPLDYYDSIPSIDYTTTDMTTTDPFEYITSPMSASGILTNDTVLSQPEYDLSYDAFANTTAISTTTPIPILTSIPALCLSSYPNVSNNCYDYLIMVDIGPKHLSEIDQNNLAKDWILNSNDSYITCQIPDDSDDWIIYVDEENFSDQTLTLGETSSADEVATSKLLTTPVSERNRSQEEPKNVQDEYNVHVTNTTTAMTTTHVTRNQVDNNTTQVVAENTNRANNTVAQIQYEYIDDTMTSCTEIPYDLVLNPEIING
ncbi:uncharacterized protein LOC133519627 [Cydia pomonella]|uniref:uncharacterized protein LOC133519627 n=1 Tax=Cydia pomonella TaxID=82600 RepID=UPI002ADD7050|nr:uncharacterized protein LOC133519627 [Cydia pomonella]